MSQALTGAARTYLRGLAHHLKPVAFLGKQGITDSFLASVNEALDSHELIKLKFNSFKEERKTLASDIERLTRSELVGMVGNVAIYYREQHDTDKRTIDIPDRLRARG